MPISFLPKAIFRSLTDVTPEFLTRRGVRLLMLDFDNTIVPYTTSVPAAEMEAWLRAMAGRTDVTVCVVSNSKKERVRQFCGQYGIPCITHAHKPGTRGIRAALEQFGAAPEQAALVGDQIYTDTLGGNRAGVMTLLVKPIHLHNLPLKARHLAELPFIGLARGRRIT